MDAGPIDEVRHGGERIVEARPCHLDAGASRPGFGAPEMALPGSMA
jgi:hypothetical protein